MNSMYDILNKMKLLEGKGSKPDFLDLDKDGDTKEPMKKAAKEKIDELSPATIASYQKKAYPQATTDGPKSDQRAAGMARSLGRPTNEEDMDEGSTGDYSAKKARAGKDIGKPGKTFAKIAKGAAERYGSKERGEKVAGAVLAKLRAKESIEEADVEEGNDFTGARLAAIRAGKPTFTVGGKTYKVTGDTSDEKVMEKKEKMLWPGTTEYEKKFPKDMKTGEKKKSSTGGEIEKTDTGVKHTAKAHDDEEETKADDGAPKRRGRPKGSKRSLGAKFTGKSKLHRKGAIKEGDLEEDYDQDEYDEEGEMAKSQSRTIADAAEELQHMLADQENLPEWVQKKITLAQEYIDSARDYLVANRPEEEEVAEVAPPGAKAERMVKHIKKGYAKDGKLTDREKAIAYATAWKAKKAGKVEEADKEEVEETTVAGSVATAPAEAPKGKKGMQFGKGVYEGKLEESYKSRLEQMLTEGMSINASQSEDGQKSLTVTATEDDAVKLAHILQLAGMPQGTGYEEACPGCGQSPCGCDESLEEADLANAPDEVYGSTELINNQGDDLHKRKSTGQTTLPTPYIGVDRQQSMARVYEEVKAEAETRLWDLYKRYENK